MQQIPAGHMDILAFSLTPQSKDRSGRPPNQLNLMVR
jgi:hypothetical protein